MSWVRISDDLHDDPRVVSVSLAAFALFHVGLGWASRHLTDGFVSLAVVRQRANRQASPLASELIQAGLWTETERLGQAGFLVAEDILSWQLTAEQAEHRRRLRAEAGRTGGKRSWEARRVKQSTSTVEANASSAASFGLKPTASRTEPPSPSPSSERKSTGARAPASIDNEATHELICKTLHEVWDQYSTRTDRMDAAKQLLCQRRLTASVDAMEKAEAVVARVKGVLGVVVHGNRGTGVPARVSA